MLGDILNVLVQKAQQPYGYHHGKQTLAGFKQGNSAQTKMFRHQALLGIHWAQGRKTILYASGREGRAPLPGSSPILNVYLQLDAAPTCGIYRPLSNFRSRRSPTG